MEPTVCKGSQCTACRTCNCRNIIEKNHGSLVAHRRAQSLQEDELLLKAFNSSKEDSWRVEREQGQQINVAIQQRQAIRLILMLCVIVAVLVIMLGVVSAALLA